MKTLMYHSIGSHANCDIGADLYSVSQENFRAQIEFLRNVREAVREIKITFDDGLLDNYTTAYPILKEAGIKAYFFIIVSRIGTPNYMNWQQIRELSDNGMIIGSHGMTHKILVGLNENELDYEIRISKKILEENLGKPIDYFSLPRGFCNEAIIKHIKENKYRAVFTSNPKLNDGFQVGRIAVKSNWDLDYFQKALGGSIPLKDKGREFMKSSLKTILGPQNYDKLRTAILKK